MNNPMLDAFTAIIHTHYRLPVKLIVKGGTAAQADYIGHLVEYHTVGNYTFHVDQIQSIHFGDGHLSIELS